MSGCHNDDDNFSKIIGPEGGTVTSNDGRIILEIPPGALDEDTEITIERFKDMEGDTGLIFFDLQPDGLQFLIPATIKIDYSGLIETGDEDIIFDNLPFILTINIDEEELEVLQNNSFNIDNDTGEVTLTADINHFSPHVAGGNTGVTGKLDGIPLQHPENTPFEAILTLNNTGVTQTGEDISGTVFYRDLSSSPVLLDVESDSNTLIFESDSNTLIFTIFPLINESETYMIPYKCGSASPSPNGIFRTRIDINIDQFELGETYSESEADFVIAFFTAFGGNIDKPIFIKTVGRVLIRDTQEYTLNASREVVCFESSDSNPTPTPQPTPSPSATPTPTSSPTPIPTPTPSPTPIPTPTPMPEESCVGFCGSESPDGCFCDDFCIELGDCCPDFEDVC
ncbi:MAG: hypothetical protein GWN56_00140, partial [Nitrosopumilaceae archaeon]|nr:hypothetical protein [Nitrosopumilaceae archaeon]